MSTIGVMCTLVRSGVVDPKIFLSDPDSDPRILSPEFWDPYPGGQFIMNSA
jgi:hypothetical protein